MKVVHLGTFDFPFFKIFFYKRCILLELFYDFTRENYYFADRLIWILYV